MIVIIGIETEVYESKISLRFARSKYFAIINKDSGKVDILKNPFLSESSSLGKQLIPFLKKYGEFITILAFELGWQMQQLAQSNKVQLAFLEQRETTLKEILEQMNLNINALN